MIKYQLFPPRNNDFSNSKKYVGGKSREIYWITTGCECGSNKNTVNINAGKKLVSNAIWQAKNCFFVNADISSPIFKETIKYNVDTMQMIHKEPRIGTS